LADAHAIKIVHRDLHPGNVMWCDATRRCRIIDWETATGHPSLANFKEVIIGVPEYQAPEFKTTMSSASDVWTFATMARELLCGKRPFVGFGPDNALGKMLIKCTDPSVSATKRPNMVDLMRLLL
jgi:serine/threonine protein kinase